MNAKTALSIFAAIVVYMASLPAAAQESMGLELPRQTRDEIISVELQNANIHSALRIFAELAGVNIVSFRGVSGKVKNFHLQDVPLKQAFALLLRTQGLYASSEGSIVIVYPLEEYLKDSRERVKR